MKGEAEEGEEALEGIPGGVTPQGSAQSKKKKKKESKTARVWNFIHLFKFPFCALSLTHSAASYLKS